MATVNGVSPRPPTAPRPDGGIPKSRPGGRRGRRHSVPSLERDSITESGISKRTLDSTTPRSAASVAEKSSKAVRPVTGSSPKHTAKSRARAAFLVEERAKFDERFAPVQQGSPARGIIVEKLPKKDQVPMATQDPCVPVVHSDASRSSVRSHSTSINATTSVGLSDSEEGSTSVFSDVSSYFYNRKIQVIEEEKRCNTEREEYAPATVEIRRLIEGEMAFLAQHPTLLAKIKQRKSVDVDDAETARCEGNYKKEFAVYKAHINDLYYNRAQVVTALNKEEEEHKKAEEEEKEQRQMVEEDNETIIQRKMRLLKEMLRNDFSSDNEEEDENDDDVTDYDDEVDDYNDSEDNYNEGDDAENEEKNDVEIWKEENVTSYDASTMTQVMEEYISPQQNSDPSPACCCSCLDCQSGECVAMSIESLGECNTVNQGADDFDWRQESMIPLDMAYDSPVRPHTSYSESLASHRMGPMTESYDFEMEKLNQLEMELEDSLLENLEKLARLLRLETAHNGTDNSAMWSKVQELISTIKAKQEADDASFNDIAEEMEHDSQDDIVISDDEPAELVTGTSTPDVEDEATCEIEEGECGQILPAFTSTSINTASKDSRMDLETLQSKSSMQTTSAKSTGNMFSAATSEEKTCTEWNGSSAPELDQEAKSPVGATFSQPKTTSDVAPKMREEKRKLSFVQGSDTPNFKQQRSNITYYANMTVDDLANLVSSALVSDIPPFAAESETDGTNAEGADSRNNTSEPSVIAVKYASILTTEKKETTLLPAFAQKHKNKPQTLAFSINGEILLSSGDKGGLSGSSISDVDDATRREESDTERVNNDQMLASQIPPLHNGSSLRFESSMEPKQTEVQKPNVETETGESTQTLTETENTERALVPYSPMTINPIPIENDNTVPERSVTPAEIKPEISTEMITESSEAVKTVASKDGKNEVDSTPSLQVGSPCPANGKNTEKSLVLYSPLVFNPISTGTDDNAPDYSVESNAGKPEVNITLNLETAIPCAPIEEPNANETPEKALVTYKFNSRIVNPISFETVAKHSATLTSAHGQSCETVDKVASENAEPVVDIAPSYEEASSGSTPEEKNAKENAETALVLYNSRLLLPILIETDGNVAKYSETLAEIQIMISTQTNGETDEVFDTAVSKQLDITSTLISVSLPDDEEKNANENTKTALVLYNPQSCNPMSIEPAAERSVTTNEETLVKESTEALDQIDVKLETESAPTFESATSCPAVEDNTTEESTELVKPSASEVRDEQETLTSEEGTSTADNCKGGSRRCEVESSDGQKGAPFYSLDLKNCKIRKSLASFRRDDLEEAVNSPDKHSRAEKLGLQENACKSWSHSVHPRASATMKTSSAEVEPMSRQPIVSEESLKPGARNNSNLGEKSSQSQPLLITADVVLLPSPSPSTSSSNLSKRDNHTDRTRVSEFSLKSPREEERHGKASAVSVENVQEPVAKMTTRASRLGVSRPKSMPATFQKDGDTEFKRSRSESKTGHLSKITSFLKKL